MTSGRMNTSDNTNIDSTNIWYTYDTTVATAGLSFLGSYPFPLP